MRRWTNSLATQADRPRPGIGAAIAAAEAKQRRSLLRNHGGGHAPVTNLELFFDLVFVFAITQLSHYLIAELTLLGALRTDVSCRGCGVRLGRSVDR